MTPQLKYTYSCITEYLPKKIKANIVYVFTNCENVLDMNFRPAEANEYFDRGYTEVIPFIIIDNPFVYS